MLLSGWRHPQRKLIDSLAVIAGLMLGVEKVRGSKWKERKNKMIHIDKNCVDLYLRSDLNLKVLEGVKSFVILSLNPQTQINKTR